jgi:hypothetical protein
MASRAALPFGGLRVDDAIEAAILKVVEPAEFREPNGPAGSHSCAR